MQIKYRLWSLCNNNCIAVSRWHIY